MIQHRRIFRRTLLAGVAAVAMTIATPEAAAAQEKPGLFGSFEGRYLMSFGQTVDVGLSFYSYLSEFEPVDLDSGVGGGLMLGYRFSGQSPQWDVAIAVSGGALDGDERDVSLAGTYSSYSVSFDGEFDAETKYVVIDFEAGYNVGLGNPGRFRAFGGVRYARFDQDVRATGDILLDFGSYGYLSTALDAERDVDYWGVGPRVGASGTIPLGNSNYSVVGGVEGAILFGERKTSDAASIDVYPYFYSASDEEYVVVGNVEGEFGLNYSLAGNSAGSADVTLGYRVETWFNVNNAEWDFVDLALGAVGDRDADQFMHGPFIRVGINR